MQYNRLTGVHEKIEDWKTESPTERSESPRYNKYLE
jgi:hypothetical protein